MRYAALLAVFYTTSPLTASDGAAPLQRTLQNMSYSISNQDTEIAHLKQKIQNQESILDSMHSEVTALIKSAKEQQKSTGNQVDTRLKSMEKNIDKLVADLKQFKKYSEGSASSFDEIQKKLSKQEEIIQLQAQQIKDLESALRHLASAMQTKSSPATSTPGEYRVKSGDSLEKIAKEHGTTIDAIRRENSLTKDVIYPGQKLHIP
jgi:LysM repeat protein